MVEPRRITDQRSGRACNPVAAGRRIVGRLLQARDCAVVRVRRAAWATVALARAADLMATAPRCQNNFWRFAQTYNKSLLRGVEGLHLTKLAQPVRIGSEEDAWKVLADLINNKIDYDDVNLAASSFDWAAINVRASGPKYHSSVPASFMRGLVEFQDSFLRSSALILRDSSHITKLSGDTRSDLDLVYQVSEGSTGIDAYFNEQLREIISKVSDKLTGKQLVVLILSLALIYGGYSAYSLHLQHSLEIETLKQNGAQDQKYLDIINQLIEKDAPDQERADVLKKAAKADKKVAELQKHSVEAKDALFRHATDVEDFSIQGIIVDHTAIADMNRRSRRKAEDVKLTETVRVEAIDAAEAHHFKVKLKRSGGGTLSGLIRDVEPNKRAIDALFRAESSRNQVSVEFTARQFGKDLRDVIIQRAWTPRKR